MVFFFEEYVAVSSPTKCEASANEPPLPYTKILSIFFLILFLKK